MQLGLILHRPPRTWPRAHMGLGCCPRTRISADLRLNTVLRNPAGSPPQVVHMFQSPQSALLLPRLTVGWLTCDWMWIGHPPLYRLRLQPRLAWARLIPRDSRYSKTSLMILLGLGIRLPFRPSKLRSKRWRSPVPESKETIIGLKVKPPWAQLLRQWPSLLEWLILGPTLVLERPGPRPPFWSRRSSVLASSTYPGQHRLSPFTELVSSRDWLSTGSSDDDTNTQKYSWHHAIVICSQPTPTEHFAQFTRSAFRPCPP